MDSSAVPRSRDRITSLDEAIRVLFDEMMPALPAVSEKKALDNYYGFTGLAVGQGPPPIATTSLDELRTATLAKITAWERSEPITYFKVELSLGFTERISLNAITENSPNSAGARSGVRGWSLNRARGTLFWRTPEKYLGIPLL